jgi:hypothetical protein
MNDFSRLFIIIALSALLAPLTGAPAALAGPGDSGRPVSSGDAPSASDALFALRASIGDGECDVCTCDVNNDGAMTATDA